MTCKGYENNDSKLAEESNGPIIFEPFSPHRRVSYSIHHHHPMMMMTMAMAAVAIANTIEARRVVTAAAAKEQNEGDKKDNVNGNSNLGIRSIHAITRNKNAIFNFQFNLI